MWWMGINGVTTLTKKWVGNLQLSERLKHNYQFKLPGNSPTVLSPTYQQFGQGPEVNLSSLNKILESCIWLCIDPWKTRKKNTLTQKRRLQTIKFNKIMTALKNNMRTTDFWWETRGIRWNHRKHARTTGKQGVTGKGKPDLPAFRI